MYLTADKLRQLHSHRVHLEAAAEQVQQREFCLLLAVLGMYAQNRLDRKN